MDLDFKIILGLKQNKKIQMEFTAESHSQKLKHLLGKFDAYLQSQIRNGCDSCQLIALFNLLRSQQNKFQLKLDAKAESELLKVLQKACKTKTKESLLIVYNILKYLSFVETLGNKEQVRRVVDGLKLNQKYEQAAIDDQQRLKADVSSNIVL